MRNESNEQAAGNNPVKNMNNSDFKPHCSHTVWLIMNAVEVRIRVSVIYQRFAGVTQR